MIMKTIDFNTARSHGWSRRLYKSQSWTAYWDRSRGPSASLSMLFSTSKFTSQRQ